MMWVLRAIFDCFWLIAVAPCIYSSIHQFDHQMINNSIRTPGPAINRGIRIETPTVTQTINVQSKDKHGLLAYTVG